MNLDRELEQWKSEWQEHPPESLNLDTLIAETRRRHRREKTLATIELVAGLTVVAACLATATILELFALERAVFVALAATAGGFTVWAFRQRHRNWRHLPMDACALLNLERQRLRDRLRYWRVSTWAVSAIWCVTLCAAAISHLLEAEVADNWLASAAGVLIVLIATVLWSILVGKQTRHHLERLDELERS